MLIVVYPLIFSVRPEKLEITTGTVTLWGVASMMMMIPGHEEKKITGGETDSLSYQKLSQVFSTSS